MLGSELVLPLLLWRVPLTVFKLWWSGDAHDMMPKAMMARVIMLLEEDEEEDMMAVVDIVVSEIMVAAARSCLWGSAFASRNLKCPPTLSKRHCDQTSPWKSHSLSIWPRKNKQGYITPPATSFFYPSAKNVVGPRRSIPSSVTLGAVRQKMAGTPLEPIKNLSRRPVRLTCFPSTHHSITETTRSTSVWWLPIIEISLLHAAPMHHY